MYVVDEVSSKNTYKYPLFALLVNFEREREL